MKHLVSLLFLLFLSHNAYAGNLCDESCELTITFPDGGSIEAVEALTFTFGEGGVVNNGVVTTGYSAGDTLVLAAGESLGFQSGGLLNLGVEGNLDYANIIITDGNVELAAIGGAKVATIYNMSLTGGVIFNLNSDAIVIDSAVLNLSGTNVTFNFSEGVTLSNYGTLNLNGGFTLAGPGTLWVDTVNWSDPNDCNLATSSSTITVSGSSVAIVENTSCAGGLIWVNPVVLSPLGGGTLTITPATITGVLDLSTTAPVIIINTDLTLSTEPLTQEFLSLFPDGFEMGTSDGNTCTISAGECVSEAGVKYVVIDGKLEPEVSEDSGSKSNGALGWFLFLLAFCLVCCRTIIYNTSLRARCSFLMIK